MIRLAGRWALLCEIGQLQQHSRRLRDGRPPGHADFISGFSGSSWWQWWTGPDCPAYVYCPWRRSASVSRRLLALSQCCHSETHSHWSSDHWSIALSISTLITVVWSHSRCWCWLCLDHTEAKRAKYFDTTAPKETTVTLPNLSNL